MKPAPRIGAQTFERLAGQTRMGEKAREMARLTLVEGHSMQSVAARLGTIPQRVRLAVGSIQRVQAAMAWNASTALPSTVPERLAGPLTALISELHTLGPAFDDADVIADVQALLHQARQRVARGARDTA